MIAPAVIARERVGRSPQRSSAANAAAPTSTVMMLRNPSRETAIIQSDPALHAIAMSAAPRPKRRAAMYVAMTPRTPTTAAAPRSVSTDEPKNRNTPATMYA